jgi:NMD protein affecting ribosome stability and mRNA decay
MPEEFTCPKCFCQSVIYPDVPDEDDYVVCRACGTVLAPLSQFRRFIERPVRSGEAVTGC